MRILFIISFLVVASSLIHGQPPRCDGCRRNAILDICTVKDPMNVVNPNGCSSISSYLVELMTTPCFHFFYTGQITVGGKNLNLSRDREPEYSFESDFVSGLDEYNDEGRPVRSRLTITMYFNGEQREFVHRWQTVGTWDIQTNSGTTWKGHSDKLKAAYKAGPAITGIMREFEKRPVDCTIDPERSDVGPGQIIEIRITDLHDQESRNSREFNRIVVHAANGTITDGEECDFGAGYKAFIVGNGTVTLHYEAPEDCESGKDKLTVYNACEVLPVSKNPLNKTLIDQKIGEKDLTIRCYDAVVTVNKIIHREIRTSESEDKQGRNCLVTSRKSQDLMENIEATIEISLKADVSEEMPVYSNQRWAYYTPASAVMTSFNLMYDEKQYSYSNSTGTDCASGGYENTLTKIREVIKPHINELMLEAETKWIVVFDTRTNKAIKMLPAGYEIDYGYNERETLVARKWPTQGKDLSYTKNRIEDNVQFDVGPVEDEVPDPTGKINPAGINDYLKGKVEDSVLIMIPPIPLDDKSGAPSEIHPDLLVETGNGITEFGGEGHKVIEKQLKGGSEKEDLTFTWNMKLKTR